MCSYEALAAALKVSSMTVRRDLGELVRLGTVFRTVGGVQRAQAPSYLYETALHSRLAVNRQEKRGIARLALGLVGPQQTLFIDGSSTCLELVRALAKEKLAITVVTNSALVCLELGKNRDITVVGIGGQYDANSLSYVGPQAEDWAKTLFIDTAFLGTKGFLPAKGTFESSLPTIRIKQIVAQRCGQVVLLADHTKFGQRALSPVLELAQIHTVITDDRVPRGELAALRRKISRVLVAPVSPGKGASHAA